MFPTPFTVTVRRTTLGPAKDDFGNPLPTMTDLDWGVYFIAPGSITEIDDGNRDLSQVAYSIGSPDGPNVPMDKDLVVIDGVEYKVSGKPANWNRGPFGFAPGVVVEVTRADG